MNSRQRSVLITSPESFLEVKEALENAGRTVAEADLDILPENLVEISDVDTAPLINADALRCDKNVVLEPGEVGPLWLDNNHFKLFLA